MLALIGTCCVQFETGQTFRPLQTDATLLAKNPKQHGTMLRLVASICMGLNTTRQSVHKFIFGVAYVRTLD